MAAVNPVDQWGLHVMNFIQLKKLPNLLITPDFLNSSQVRTIPIVPVPGSVVRNCTLNVKRFIEANGGSAQYGWAISALGNVLVRFVGHCVARQESGELICVTPSECSYLDEMAFIPDQSIAPIDQGLERLPSITIPLINNSIAAEYADLDNVSSKIKRKYPSRISLDDNRSSTPLTKEDSALVVDATMRARRLMPVLQALVARTYGPNQYCFCNSGKKYKKCCKQT